MNEHSQPSRPLEVKLISKPEYPLGTLFYVWEQSRSNDPVPSPMAIETLLNCTDEYSGVSSLEGEAAVMLGGEVFNYGVYLQPTRKRLWDVITQIMDEDIPCTENLNFVFAIENMPISLREQMVRHRIGVHVGDRLGIDIVPDLAESSWWSQTMRMLPMDKFFTEGRYILPDSLAGKIVFEDEEGDPVTGRARPPVDAREVFIDLMAEIEFIYNKLIEAGVAMEDARQIIPIGATHSITWCLNLKAMMHILGKRACWVAQANLWEQLISGMVNELCDQIHPMFRKIIQPPCFKKSKYNACPYFQINRERVQGRDHMPPCPLYVYHQTNEAIDAFRFSVEDTGQEATWSPPGDPVIGGLEEVNRDIRRWNTTQEVERRMLNENIERFERLWKLNVMTGEPL